MAISIEDLSGNAGFTQNVKGKVTLLPDPPRAERWYTVISCDDHVVEPPHTFEGRVPAAFAERAPRVVEQDDGREMWLYDGELLPNVGFNAVVGRPVDEYSFDPTRFDEMRRGAWDITARVVDMMGRDQQSLADRIAKTIVVIARYKPSRQSSGA